eukprot:CCRYP_011107-RC/>CCRYP_011107-RC protein AED:0.18 eAED:0.40 QI:311/0.33/0.25/1/0.33/0.25/4/0/403
MRFTVFAVETLLAVTSVAGFVPTPFLLNPSLHRSFDLLRRFSAATDDITGTVKWYNAQRGFGFIAVDDGGPDMYVHATGLEFDGPLIDGDRVRFVTEIDRRTKKPKAVGVVRANKEPTSEATEVPTPAEANSVVMEEASSSKEEEKVSGQVEKNQRALLEAKLKNDQEARIAAEAEQARIAKEAEEKQEARIAAEAEQARLAKEAEQKRLAEEAEKALLAKEAEEARIAAEQARLAKEAEQKRLAEEAEKARLAKEAEDARIAAEQARLAKEAEEKRLAEEAEKARLAKEAEEARIAAEQARLAKEAEEKRLAEEAEKARLEEEARLAKEEAEARARGYPNASIMKARTQHLIPRNNELLTAKYAAITDIEEKAFTILTDLGMLELSLDPDDASFDDEDDDDV